MMLVTVKKSPTVAMLRADYLKAFARAAKYSNLTKKGFLALVKKEAKEAYSGKALTPEQWVGVANNIAEDMHEGYCDGEADLRMCGSKYED